MKPRIPPPIILAIALAATFAVSMLNPIQSLKFSRNTLTACIFVITGLIIMVWAVFAFKTAKTTINPLHPNRASSLVVNGPFRISRNPMYLGMVFILFAGFNMAGDFLSLVIFGIFLIYMDQVQIGAEEKAMQNIFGDDFVNYSKSVRRWI